MKYALVCLICMCVNTVLYMCLLCCGGRKGCEIWSVFQEKQLAPSPSRQNQAGLLPCFGHLATLCRVRPVLWEEESRICRVRRPLMPAREWWCPSVHELMPSTARKPPGVLLAACSLLCWVCRHFERGRLGPAWKPLPPFMIGTACEEKLSFFPRACGTSFTGPACC